MSFSDTSSLDFSLLDFELDDEPEIHPFTVRKKRKHKKKGTRRRKYRRRMRKLRELMTLTSDQFIISDFDIYDPTPPPAPEEIPDRAPLLTKIPALGLAPIIGQSEEGETEETVVEEKEIIRDEVEEMIKRHQQDNDPEPVGIISILMKRRRDRAAEERRLPPPPPTPPPTPSTSVQEESIVSEEEESLSVVHEVKKPKPPIFINCRFNKPGPGQYDHYSTVGYIGHDPTKKRAPGFSFGRRIKIKEKRCGPGPKYNMRGFTERGKEKPISHEFGKRRPDPPIEISPGPADYKDQTLYLSKRSTGALLYGRREEKKVEKTPVAIGELQFMGSSKPAACLLGKPKAPKPNKFPSPLSYAPVKLDVYKTRSPSFTMGYNRKPPKKDADNFPTVGTYSPNYDYLKKKGNITIPSSNGSCVRIPLDLPEKKKKL